MVVRGDLDEDAEVFFQNVPADEALETLARAYGLSLEKRGNIYSLRPHVEGSPPPKLVSPMSPVPPVPPVAPRAPGPPLPPMPPMPPMPKMGHPGHPSASDDEDTDAEDSADPDEDEGENATPPSDFDDQARPAQGSARPQRPEGPQGPEGRAQVPPSRRALARTGRRSGPATSPSRRTRRSTTRWPTAGACSIKGHVRNDAVAFGGNVQLGPACGGRWRCGRLRRQRGARVRRQGARADPVLWRQVGRPGRDRGHREEVAAGRQAPRLVHLLAAGAVRGLLRAGLRLPHVRPQADEAARVGDPP